MARKSALLHRLRRHFDQDPATLPVVEQNFASYERPNLHLVFEELLGASQCHADLVGVVALEEYPGATLARLSRKNSARKFDAGPVEYRDVPLADGQHLACVKHGLYLFHDDGRPVAALITEGTHPLEQKLVVEVMATHRELAERFIRELTRLTRLGKAFRGHILSLEQDCHGILSVHFHHLPRVDREELVLAEKLLQRIERHVVSFSRHAEKLRAPRRHLKRGILLHGPPGTGKTLSAMYLVGQSPGRTVLLVTGAGMGAIETACKLARMLAPATVILEDVDLIGTQRHMQTVDANALLFELLNQMDGLADDTDVLFILTTNRPDILEPALASRPGRIDQAIEVPLPDAACRRRLVALYGRGLQLEITGMEGLIERTAGVSAAFIRELLRKAAVFAAEEDGESPLAVRDRHIEEALIELLVSGGALTQSLLGAKVSAGDE